MTRVGTRPIAAFIAAVLVAVLFAACGGSSSDSASTTTTAGDSPTVGSGAQEGARNNSSRGSSEQKGSQSGNNEQGPDSDQGEAQQTGGSSGGRGNVSTPLKVSGGGSAQFRSKGGDNSIQEFGDEGSESELQEAAEAVHGFLVAEAEEDWGKACSYLAKSNIEQLEQLGSQSPQLKGAGCAPILAALTQPLPAAAERRITTVDAGSLRHEGEQGFLIYFGDERVKYSMPLRNEGGSWKVTALSATTLG